ncbi:Nramp family divalent metal transporter [Oceanobacillus caeni]|uniref:Nramp family divalent metal transporter n=1 Tax=Oceanobacillus caeni TaxID=405946 RepID=UPI0019585D46
MDNTAKDLNNIESSKEKKSLLGMFKQIGPGMLVAGAFIGTGTITTSTVAGTNNGYSLLWASVTLAVIVAIILQEMSARLSLSSGQSLAKLIRTRLGLWASIIAVLAIVGGNAIYSVGNLAGVELALGELISGVSGKGWMFVVTLIYWGLLMIGKFSLLEKTITFLVATMGLTFLINMFYVKPVYSDVLFGLTVPRFEITDIMLVLSLIGTTVVPYNLYLHSSAVVEKKWHKKPKENLKLMRLDTIFPIFIGGLITMAVGVVAGTVLHPLHVSNGLEIQGAGEMAMALQPLLGNAAYALFSIGLFAAAISSMPMAALSAAYVFTESFGLSSDLKSLPFRIVFSFVAWVPFIFAVGITNPVWTIILAQTVNGMLLPITAVAILYLINRKEVVGDLRNRTTTNILGFVAVGFAIYLGVLNILNSLGVL